MAQQITDKHMPRPFASCNRVYTEQDISPLEISGMLDLADDVQIHADWDLAQDSLFSPLINKNLELSNSNEDLFDESILMDDNTELEEKQKKIDDCLLLSPSSIKNNFVYSATKPIIPDTDVVIKSQEIIIDTDDNNKDIDDINQFLNDDILTDNSYSLSPDFASSLFNNNSNRKLLCHSKGNLKLLTNIDNSNNNSRILKNNKKKSLKTVMKRKSGVWEMISTNVGISEFMI